MSETQDKFDYERAFIRNLGLVQPEEQKKLKNSRVAIAGLGGVGGTHVVTLTRTGIGKFHLADFDHFELHNFNRQSGAMMSTLQKPKSEVMHSMAKDINPSAEVVVFDQGVNRDNIHRFLEGVDVVVDGLDFFAVDARDLLYSSAREKKIPVVGAGPIGFSMILLTFMPDQMSWHEYFAMDMAKSQIEKYLLFGLGNAPKGTHISYIDKSYVNLDKQQGPSCAAAVQLCGGVIAVEVMKLLLNRGKILAAPYYHQFDVYKYKYVKGKLRKGNRGLMQRMKFHLFKTFYLSSRAK